MAKFHRKHIAKDRIEITIGGEPCALVTRRPNMRDLLELAQLGGELRRTVSGSSIDAAAYARLICSISPLVVDVEGIEDEDGEPIRWEFLADGERDALLLEVDLDAALAVYAQLANAGRLTGSEKKDSEPTSPPSSVEIDAGVRCAPEESSSPA